MNLFWKITMASALATNLSLTAPPVGNTVLFKAHIQSVAVDELQLESEVRDRVDLSFPARARLAITEHLIGTTSPLLSVWLRMGALPAKDSFLDLIVLAEKKPDGSLTVLDWGYAIHDFCIDRTTAKRLRIESELSELYANKKLRCQRLDPHVSPHAR